MNVQKHLSGFENLTGQILLLPFFETFRKKRLLSEPPSETVKPDYYLTTFSKVAK
jgi:hypothetical protein